MPKEVSHGMPPKVEGELVSLLQAYGIRNGLQHVVSIYET